MTILLHRKIVGDCASCTLQGTHVVNGYGPRRPKLAIIAEAPGSYETRMGRPLIGPSGRLIRLVLQAVGLDDVNDVYYTNSVLCRGNENAKPGAREIRACNTRLRIDELPEVMPAKILTLGGPALTAMMSSPRVLPITKWRGLGMMVDVGGRPTYMVPTYHPAAVLRSQDLFRDLVTDLEKVLTHDAPIPDLDIDINVPYTVDEALDALTDFGSAGTLSCDLETTGFNYLHDLPISIGFGVRDSEGKYYSLILHSLVYRDERVKRAIDEILHTRNIVFHNGKFDLKFLEAYIGKKLHLQHSHDTMLLHYCLDERPGGGTKQEDDASSGNIKTKLHSLKTIARVKYDVPDYGLNWDQFYQQCEDDPQQVAELFKYQARDCAYTLRLYNDLIHEADAESLRLYESTLMPASHALRIVEKRGILLDRDNLKRVQEKYHMELDRLRLTINDLALELTGIEEVNAGSPQQVVRLIEALGIDLSWVQSMKSIHTKDVPSLSEKVVLHRISLAHAGPIRMLTQALMSYRVIKSVLATHVDGIDTRADIDDRIRTNFLLHGTSTGRLSSANPNLQNFPNFGASGGDTDLGLLSHEIRNSFIPTPGFTFVDVDFGQLELRVLAYFTDDEALKEVFITGQDIHTRVASEIFNKPPDAINSDERRHGKVIDFGIVYGRSPAQIVNGPEMDVAVEQGGERWTIKKANEFLNRFFEGFPKVEPWLRSMRKIAHTQHEVRSPMGRTRRLPLILPDGHAERQAVNSPIQSFASDICLHALIKLVDILPEDKARVLLTIHDSILLEIRDDALDELIPVVQHTMENTHLVDTSIPFTVELKVGKSWGTMKGMNLD